MTVELQIALWGIAVCVPLLVNSLTKSSADALGLSGMLVLIWVMGRVLGALYSPPQNMTLYPVIDAMAGVTAFGAWASRRAWWKMGLVMLLTGQCVLHAAFWLAWPSDGILVRYLWVNNVLFALQLICVGWPGARHVAHRVVDRMSHRPWARHHARA